MNKSVKINREKFMMVKMMMVKTDDSNVEMITGVAMIMVLMMMVILFKMMVVVRGGDPGGTGGSSPLKIRKSAPQKMYSNY